MLTLTIKDGHSLRIGDDIKIELNRKRELGSYNKQQVSVAISAPKDVVILREELLWKDKPTTKEPQ